MDDTTLSYVLSSLPDKSVNTYGRGIYSSAMANYARATEQLGFGFLDQRDEKNRRHLILTREDGSELGRIEPSKLPTCEKPTKAICNSKIRSAEIWDKVGVPTPATRVYAPDEMELATRRSFQEAREVVVKAHSLTLGAGVFLNVSRDEFGNAFEECVELQREAGRKPLVLVQEMVYGFEMRATVVEGVVDNFLLKIPAYVTGDGVSTLDQLIESKNERRSHNSFFRNKPIRRDQHMEAHFRAKGKSLGMIPAIGDNVALSSISAIAYGGESAVVSELISDKVKEYTLRSVAAIPGATTAGVDLMLESFSADTPKIVEINAFPHMNCIHPYYGAGSDTAVRYIEAVYAIDSCRRSGVTALRPREATLVADYLKFLELKDSMSVAAVGNRS